MKTWGEKVFSPGGMMQKNERLKKKNIYNNIVLSTFVLFFIGTLVGCSNETAVQTEEITARIAGRIQNDSGLKGIPVRLSKLDTSGAIETISLEDGYTDSEGKFILKTNITGTDNLRIEADNGITQWRGIITSGLIPGITVYTQPLNSTTTVAADLFQIAFASGNKPDYTQIRLLIDEEIAGIIDNKADLMRIISDAIMLEFNAEKETMLRSEIGGTTSQWQQINVARIAAQTALDRDLYYALSESAKKAAVYNYLGSVSDAYVDVGMQSDTFSKVLEASVRTFLKKIEGINSRLEIEFTKRTSWIRARVLNAAVLSEFQKLGADPSMLAGVIAAGENLEDNLEDAESTEDIANEFTEYHDECRENLIKVLGLSGNSIGTFQENIDDYKNTLISDIEGSNDSGEIISAYMNFYGSIRNLVGQHLNSGNVLQDAAAEVLILINMYF
jgi:hypothetical protein